jgi:hypothetical protein
LSLKKRSSDAPPDSTSTRRSDERHQLTLLALEEGLYMRAQLMNGWCHLDAPPGTRYNRLPTVSTTREEFGGGNEA